MINLVSRLADAFTAGSYGTAWALVRALPSPVARRVFDAAADLAVLRGGKGVDRLKANLARVAPGQDLTKAAMRSYARYWGEVFRLPSIKVEHLVDRTVIIGAEHFWAGVRSPAGLVLTLPHSGNWDAAGAWCTGVGVPFTTVAERLKPETLYDQFVAFRESLGMEVLALTGGPQSPYEVLEQRLRDGGTICLMGDRDLTPRGVDVNFFGATARMPAGPARLALATGAVLVPATLAFTDRGWQITFHEAIAHTDVTTMTQQVADRFALGIAEHPQDWHMLQRVWLDDLDPTDPRVRPSG